MVDYGIKAFGSKIGYCFYMLIIIKIYFYYIYTSILISVIDRMSFSQKFDFIEKMQFDDI